MKKGQKKILAMHCTYRAVFNLLESNILCKPVYMLILLSSSCFFCSFIMHSVNLAYIFFTSFSDMLIVQPHHFHLLSACFNKISLYSL